MKRLYDFITKANQVLLFLLVLAATGGIGYRIYQESSHDRWSARVPVVQNAEEAKKIVVDDVRFLGKASDYYVLGIVKREVAAPREESGDISSAASKISGGGGASGQIVNVVFANGTQRIRTLFPHDGLVLSDHVASRYRDDEFKAHRFRCVTEDTDGNHLLDSSDRVDLHIVPVDLAQPELVIKGAADVDVVSPTKLVVKIGGREGIHFFEVDIVTREQREIVWK